MSLAGRVGARWTLVAQVYVPDETRTSDQFMVFHAQRSYYEQLLRAGVKIFLHPPPTVLHSKHVSIDDDVAIIGSSNMDIRSLSLHLELTSSPM